jgi:hypothetical protein
MSPRQTAAVSFGKRLFLLVILGAASIFLIKAIYALEPEQSQESSSQERKLKITEFNHVPLEVQIRNLQSETWHKDLEIEVKNIFGRPIYFILAYLTFPDERPANSTDEVGTSLHYGKPENISVSHLADPKDEHLEPDEKYVFTLPEPQRSGFEDRYKRHPELAKNLQFWVALVSFGDGTGWELGEQRDKRLCTKSLNKVPRSGTTDNSPALQCWD